MTPIAYLEGKIFFKPQIKTITNKIFLYLIDMTEAWGCLNNTPGPRWCVCVTSMVAYALFQAKALWMSALCYDESQKESACMFRGVESGITSSKPPKECSTVSIATMRKLVGLYPLDCGWASFPLSVQTSYMFSCLSLHVLTRTSSKDSSHFPLFARGLIEFQLRSVGVLGR